MRDIHKEFDTRNINIDYIGVDKVRLPISFYSKEVYNSIATIDSGVSLDANEKGAHLSRIIETFNEFLKDKFLTIKELDNLLMNLSERVETRSILVNIKFPIMIPSKSPVSDKVSYIDTLIGLEAFKKNDNIEKKVEVAINGAMCCPSSKEISKYGAHSQRCLLKVQLNGEIDDIKVEDVVKYMEESFSAPVNSVVKRIDEKYLTETAYENPKFSEDLIRDILITLNQAYNNIDIEAESINYESIHAHNVRAKGSIKR